MAAAEDTTPWDDVEEALYWCLHSADPEAAIRALESRAHECAPHVRHAFELLRAGGLLGICAATGEPKQDAKRD